jgi:release factor H-coupled RctB family protein
VIHLDERTRIVASPSSWIEGEAARQLRDTAALPGVRWAVGLPDLHPGKGCPIGAAVLADGVVYPHLVGGDIGCGMALFQTGLGVSKARGGRLAKRLQGIEGTWAGDGEAWLAAHGVSDVSFAASVGTIGGGNHFAELQAVEALFEPEKVRGFGVEEGSLLLLVHSGSRGFGESILRAHAAAHGARGLAVAGDTAAEARAYLAVHDEAVRWARANRALIARRVADALGLELRPLLDVCHNGVTAHADAWLHRKGATPHDCGIVAIPGSRGALTYLVEPTGSGADVGFSLAHGAGRKWTRRDARARMRERFRPAELVRTALGGTVICEDRDLLFEEAPEAYKRIDRVMADLVEAGACRVLATLRPVLTYKTRRGAPGD